MATFEGNGENGETSKTDEDFFLIRAVTNLHVSPVLLVSPTFPAATQGGWLERGHPEDSNADNDCR
jgi:hypothetical protein